MKINIYLILLLVHLCACTHTSDKEPKNDDSSSTENPFIIDFQEMEESEKAQKISEFADSVKYIYLDEEPLLPAVNPMMDLYVDEDENFYIKKDFLYVYDKDGKFKKSIYRKGQGPKEITQALGRPAYDMEGKYISIWNYGSGYYSQYSKNGDYLTKVPATDSTRYDKRLIAHIGNNDIFYYSYPTPQRGEFFNLDGPVLWYAKDVTKNSIVYKKINPFFNVKVKKGKYVATTYNYPLLYSQIDSIFWVKHLFQDTIFQTKDGIKWKAWYIIKHHKRDVDYEELMSLTLGAVFPDELFARTQLFHVIPLPSGLLYSFMKFGEKELRGGFCKHGEKVRICSRFAFKNDIDDHLADMELFNVPIFQRNGYLYVMIDSFKFFEGSNKPPFPGMTEESNPIIIKLKLRNNV